MPLSERGAVRTDRIWRGFQSTATATGPAPVALQVTYYQCATSIQSYQAAQHSHYSAHPPATGRLRRRSSWRTGVGETEQRARGEKVDQVRAHERLGLLNRLGMPEVRRLCTERGPEQMRPVSASVRAIPSRHMPARHSHEESTRCSMGSNAQHRGAVACLGAPVATLRTVSHTAWHCVHVCRAWAHTHPHCVGRRTLVPSIESPSAMRSMSGTSSVRVRGATAISLRSCTNALPAAHRAGAPETKHHRRRGPSLKLTRERSA